MSDNDVFCEIFIDTDLDYAATLELVQKQLSIIEQATGVTNHDFSLEKRDEFDIEKRKEFPSGFLYFPFTIEFENNVEDQKKIVKPLLGFLWSQNIPAVIACDYADELPHNGGYRSRDVPWPKWFECIYLIA